MSDPRPRREPEVTYGPEISRDERGIESYVRNDLSAYDKGKEWDEPTEDYGDER